MTNIFHCTVSIIKIKDKINNILIDISFGKPYENGKIVELINKFCNYKNDIRIRQLIVVIKYWTKQRHLNDSTKHLLNSFGFVLLILKYLQTKNVLPMLKKVRYMNEYLCNEVELMIDKQLKIVRKNKLSLADLLIGFFEYYSEFDYENESVSLFDQKVMKRDVKYRDLTGYDLQGNALTFVIEGPIQTNYNCAKLLQNQLLI